MIRSHHGRTPQIAASAYIDPQAVVIGDVSIGELSSVWPCVVIRGDVNWIRIGSRTNIQDGSILHVYKDTHPLQLADAALQHCDLPRQSLERMFLVKAQAPLAGL